MGEIAINPIHNVHKKYRKMNLVNHYVFTPPIDVSTNTYIGGVASTISTPALLASKLAIDVSRLTNFSIVGSDIKCKITGSYGMPTSAFLSDTSVTYLYDYDSLITSFTATAFRFATNFRYLIARGVTTITGVRNFERTKLELLDFPNLTSAPATAFNNIGTSNGQKTNIYIPNCVTLGVNVTANENVFFGIIPGSIIYAKPSLATINSGGVEGDLAYAIAQGAIVRYVTNYTSPSPVTTLASGTIYNKAVQLTFTAPSSTNAIDYYECWESGVLKNTITASSQYITKLVSNSSQSIVIYAVDVFMNKSLVSNTLSVSTTSTNTTSSETSAFASRISADSGMLIDQTYVNDEFCDKILGQNLHNNLLAWHNYKSGFKKDGSNLVEKMYSFMGSNTDVIQTTTANKPIYTTTGVTFDTTDKLEKTLPTALTNRSFTLMWRLKATPANYYPAAGLPTWGSYLMHSSSGGMIYAGTTSASRFALETGSFLTNTDATYIFTFNNLNTTAKIYRNGTLLSTMTQATPSNFTGISVDAQNGTFYDLKVFDKELSLTEITNLL
jgi:hypothetical protein